MPRGCGRRSAAGACRSRPRAICPSGPRPPTPPGIFETVDRLGGRFVCPGDAEWPSQLDDLHATRPFGLWLRGGSHLRLVAVRSVAVVGARAATAYGEHVSGELAADLADAGWAVVSGGAFGVDAASHRGALAAGGATVAVLASGIDVPYPRGHDTLFDRIAHEGLLVTDWPPGAAPARLRFLVRKRVIAALTRGTVVVEAAARSGALNTARHARELGRLVMAGPARSRPRCRSAVTGCFGRVPLA
ncbi:MAG TPA: DNA-processing protein DprA [Mycobacteriales bacterium]|nr:DNA-processing protein DprA [Mycobacteriales bacterium]